jgi:hypothetical protein
LEHRFGTIMQDVYSAISLSHYYFSFIKELGLYCNHLNYFVS